MVPWSTTTLVVLGDTTTAGFISPLETAPASGFPSSSGTVSTPCVCGTGSPSSSFFTSLPASVSTVSCCFLIFPAPPTVLNILAGFPPPEVLGTFAIVCFPASTFGLFFESSASTPPFRNILIFFLFSSNNAWIELAKALSI